MPRRQLYGSLMATVQAELTPTVGRRREEPRARWSAWTVRWAAVWAVTVVLCPGPWLGAWAAWEYGQTDAGE